MNYKISKDGKTCYAFFWKRYVAEGEHHYVTHVADCVPLEWDEFCRSVGDDPEDFIEISIDALRYNSDKGIFEDITKS